jgi:hypothetical protein
LSNCTLQEIQNMDIGDEIIFDSAFGKDVAHVCLGRMSFGPQIFSNLNGSNLMVKDDETIKSFNVRSIDSSNEKWDQTINEYALKFKQLLT